jgi:hypothetical protein
MKNLKEEEDVKAKRGDQRASPEEIERVMSQFIKEQEEMSLMKETGKRLRRPPQTAKETIDTLKEADDRYEANKKFLFGSQEVA